MSKLICTGGMNKGDEFSLSEGNNVLGRAPECNIVLFDKKCSRRHCQVIKKGAYYAVEDLNSRNGSYVNGKPLVKKQEMKIGDHVHVGKTTLILSEKPLGNVLTQAATEAAADLQGKKFDKLLNAASQDVAQQVQQMEKKMQVTEQRGLRGLLARLFGRR